MMEEGEERVRSPKEQISTTTTTTTKQDVGMEGHGEKEKWAKGQGHKHGGHKMTGQQRKSLTKGTYISKKDVGMEGQGRKNKKEKAICILGEGSRTQTDRARTDRATKRHISPEEQISTSTTKGREHERTREGEEGKGYLYLGEGTRTQTGNKRTGQQRDIYHQTDREQKDREPKRYISPEEQISTTTTTKRTVAWKDKNTDRPDRAEKDRATKIYF